jgi:thioredoxin-like negative regulator of GroEL
MTSSENFKSFVPFKRDLKTPCLLFAKWDNCGHCHAMAPHVKRVQTSLRGIMPVYLIDAEKHKKVCDQLQIRGFPEIMFLGKDRRIKKYQGPPDAPKILAFVKTHMR